MHRRPILRRGSLAALALASLLLALAACGQRSSGGATVGGATGTATPSPTATTTATATSGQTGSTSAKGCPNTTIPANAESSPATLILTQKTSEGTVHVGDVVAIHLPATSRWHSNDSTSAQLKAVGAQGALDSAANVCVWSYQAQATGTATLTFTGTPICQPGEVCPTLAILATFTIHVS